MRRTTDGLIAICAFAFVVVLACGGLLLFSLIGYAQLRDKSPRDVALFVAALILVPAFFIAIFAAFAPQYLGMFRRLY